MILSATKDSTAMHKDRQVTAVDELIQEEKKKEKKKIWNKNDILKQDPNT